MPGGGCGKRDDDTGRTPVQHHTGRQLPGVAAQEELAERARALHQEQHGALSENLLSAISSFDVLTSGEIKRGKEVPGVTIYSRTFYQNQRRKWSQIKTPP